MRAGRSVLCLVAAILLSRGLAAADWPQFRGPQRDGVSRDTGLLSAWPRTGPPLAWRLDDIGDGYSTPSVVGERLYLMANKGLDNEYVLALSAIDGKTVWTTRIGRVGNPNQQPSYPTARSTPTVDGAMLYAFSSDGDLACLDRASGKVIWQKSVRKEFGGQPGEWAYAESPLVDGDVVVVTPGGPTATIVALNKRTGALIWKSAVPGGDPAGYASAIIVEAAGRKQYVQFLGKGIVGVDARTGQFLWRWTEPSKGPANMPTPIAFNGHVYSGARNVGGTLARLVPSATGVSAEQVYIVRDLPNSIGGSVLVNGHLYGTTPDGLVSGEFTSGKLNWKAESIGAGSVSYADGHLYVHGENGDIALVEATPTGYKEKGRFSPPQQPRHARGGGERAWPYPVVANGRLFIRDLGTLWAFDVRATGTR